MFAFLDHVTHPQTGRPEPHFSWGQEAMITWFAAAGALVSAARAAYEFANWGDAQSAGWLLLFAVMIGSLAFIRHRMLETKRAEFREALAAYEAALALTAEPLSEDAP